MSVDYRRPSGATMHGSGTGQRHRLVVVVGVLLIIMTAGIVGVTVWVVTQQSAADEVRGPTETLVNYVGWEQTAGVPESDASRRLPVRGTVAPVEEEQQLQTSPPDLDPGISAQRNLTQFTGSLSLSQPAEMEQGYYPQNVAEVMKHMRSQQLQQPQRPAPQGVRQGGTIQSYGVLETYPSHHWPTSPNRMGQAFQGVAYPFQPQQQMTSPSGPPNRLATLPPTAHPTESVPETSGAAPHGGLRPFHPDLGRDRGPGLDQDHERDHGRDPSPYRRRHNENRGGRPRRPPPRRQPPPFRSRSELNRTETDSTVSAGLDLAVSGWSAFSFGIFLIKKLLQIMGYGGHESRAMLDETDLFVRALEVAGRVVGFDAGAELAVLEDITSSTADARSWSPNSSGADQGASEPPLSRVDLVNRMFGVGLNLVNLFTGHGELNVAECLWGAYCEELHRRSREAATTDAIVAKVNTIGLQLIRGDVQEYIGVGEMMDRIRNSQTDSCGRLFPECHGKRAVEFMDNLLGPGVA